MDGGNWKLLDLESDGGSLLDDVSVSDPKIGDLFEQDKISCELKSILYRFLTEQSPMQEGMLIALNGRHGQGKSTVLKDVSHSLDRTFLKGKKKTYPIRVSEFNCADYSSDDLRNNFDYFLETSRGWPLFVPLLIALLVFSISILPPSIAIWMLGASSEATDLAKQSASVLSGAILTIILVGLRPSRLLARDVWRKLRIGCSFNEIFVFVSDRLFVSADIIVIDDLDRAEPDQQRALLQSLKRHRDDFRSAVIVAFDDAPLLKALDGKRETSDFITKVFDVSLRLSPMNARDAAAMACGFSEEIYRINSECSIARIFMQPMIAGDLARVFMLHGNASARFAKKLVNNVYIAARVGGFRRSTDVSALIRLHGVFQYIPALETELDVVADSLLGSSESNILAFVRERFGNDLPEVLGSKLKRFLSLTDHMQPSNVGWLRLLRIWRTQPLGSGGDLLASDRWHRRWSLAWALNDAFIAGLADESDRRRAYSSLLLPGNEFVRLNEIELRSNGTGAFKFHDTQPTSEDFDFWRGLCTRLHINDDVANEDVPQQKLVQILRSHQAMPVGQLLLFRRNGVKFSSARNVVRHNFLSPEEDIKNRLRFDLAEFYASPSGGIENCGRPQRKLDNADVSALNSSWPTLLDLETGEVIDEHFGDLALVLLDFPFSSKVLPDSHLEWLTNMIQRDRCETSLFALTKLTAGSGAEEVLWPIGAVEKLWEHLGIISGVDQKFVNFLLERVSPPWNDSVALWLLAVRGLDDQLELPDLDNSVVLANGASENASLWHECVERIAHNWESLRQNL